MNSPGRAPVVLMDMGMVLYGWQAEDLAKLVGVSNNVRSFTTNMASNAAVALLVIGNDAIEKYVLRVTSPTVVTAPSQ